MIKYENECVGCPKEMGCMGDSCPNRNVKHLYCDICSADVDTLYYEGSYELCEECLLKTFEKITL